MLKQSCGRDQPLVLFFDLCQRNNPCLNAGTCQSLPPNYDDALPNHQQPSEINYKCLCPVDTSGEHCQYLQYPFGYCLNGGSLIDSIDVNNRPIKVCLCVQGFQGDHCEENVNDCLDIVCSNHGMCQDAINNFTCACFVGFYGNQCEEASIEIVLLQVVSKSFAIVAVMLIAGIAVLVVASDIHTYATSRKPREKRLSIRRPIHSQLLNDSTFTFESNDVQIEMTDLPSGHSRRKTQSVQTHSLTGYRALSKSRPSATF
jgi:hypothetical protein